MQILKRNSASLGVPSRFTLAASLILIPLVMGASAYAQTSEAVSVPGTGVAAPVVPQQVRYAGKLATRSGDTVEAVFNIYAAQEGGEPLWTETQKVAVDQDGAYTVLLGSASQAGLPQTLFAAGAARWLGISVERAPEQARVLLSSVPYAMKSADTQALSGHPAGDFVTQEQLSQFAQTEAQRIAAPEFNPLLSGTITGSGTTGTIPQFTGANTIGNSLLTQSGSDIGVNEATPAATLDVNGTGQFRGTLLLPSFGTATTSGGARSQELQWNASAWSTTTAGPITPTYKMYVGAAANNSANATGTLLFTYQVGGGAASTILSLNANGSFVTYGGVSAKTPTVATSAAGASSPLLGLIASTYKSSTSTAISQNWGWQAIPTGNNTTTPSSNISLIYGAGNATPAPTGFSIAANGLVTFVPGQTFPGGGGGTITGITTSSPLTGSGTAGSVNIGLNQSTLTTNITPGLETTFDSRYAKLSGGNIFSSYLDAYQTAGPGNAAILGWGSSGSVGTFGDSDTGYGLQGESTSGFGTYSQVTTPAAGSAGVLGFTGSAFSGSYTGEAGMADAGVWADTSAAGSATPVALFATGDDAFGAAIVTNGADYPSLFVDNNTGTAGEFMALTGDGLDASTSTGTGVNGTTSGGGNGVEGWNTLTTSTEAGVLGVANATSVVYGSYNIYAGVWGDTGTDSDSISPAWAIGVLGTADNSHAGVFLNNSADWSTMYISNASTGGTGLGNFKTMMASSAEGTCGIGGGSMTCTGPIKSLASAGNGARTVETYGVQSPENWMEDFGTGQLEKGVSVVKIDATFAETVSGTADYHVFITPRGDSKGLYVINATPTSFEVRESGGGTSTLSFDYRIVAKRRGYEAMRHVDVTESYNAEMRAAKMVRGSGVVHKPAPMAKSRLQLALNSHPRRLVPGRIPVRHQPMSQPVSKTTQR